MKITLSLIILFSVTKLWAYPNFVGYGYKNCLTCHYNPYGNGPLNDYGRAVSASVIADRLFIPEDITDETLGDRSTFFGTKEPLTKHIRPGLDWRHVYIESGLESEDNRSYQNFVMQREAHLTLVFGERQNYILSASYMSLPADNYFEGQEAETYSREHYIGFRFAENHGVYIGKMDKIHGVRIVDHIAFSRGGVAVSPEGKMHSLGLGFEDQVHGVVYHYGDDKQEFGLQYFVGDREQAPQSDDTYPTGFSAKYDHNFYERLKLGTSFTSTSSLTQDQNILSVHALLQAGKGSSLLAEYGTSGYTPVSGEEYRSNFLMVQSSVKMRRGLFFLTTLETVNPNTEEDYEIYRIAPAMQWFPWQRVEFRVDLQNQRIFSDSVAQQESWRLITQLHLWL